MWHSDKRRTLFVWIIFRPPDDLEEPGPGPIIERPKESSTPFKKSNLENLKSTEKTIEDSSETEEIIRLESGSGSRVKFSIPGTSESVTLNFPAEVLDQVSFTDFIHQVDIAKTVCKSTKMID